MDPFVSIYTLPPKYKKPIFFERFNGFCNLSGICIHYFNYIIIIYFLSNKKPPARTFIGVFLLTFVCFSAIILFSA